MAGILAGVRTAYYKVRRAWSVLRGWVAWGALQELQPVDVADEPAEPLFLEFGPSRPDAVDLLQCRMIEQYGPLEFIEQACDPIPPLRGAVAARSGVAETP